MKPEFNSLDKDLELKKQAKYDPERERQALDWVKQVSGMPLDGDFYTALKDGQALCMAINKILPEKPIKISNSKMAFKQMENIHAFLEKIRVLGVPSFESFQTIDLFEAKNLIQVTDCIFSVSRNAEKRGWQGPRLGPKLADKNERQFTEEQLLQAKMAVPLLQSYTKGASQAGMGAFGGRREIGGVYVEKPDEAASDPVVSVTASVKVVDPVPAVEPVPVVEPVAEKPVEPVVEKTVEKTVEPAIETSERVEPVTEFKVQMAPLKSDELVIPQRKESMSILDDYMDDIEEVVVVEEDNAVQDELDKLENLMKQIQSKVFEE